MKNIEWDDIEDAAAECAGNWRQFDSFVWWRDDMLDPEHWFITYTHHRDSGLLDESNALVIDKALEPFEGTDTIQEHHTHWAVGWVDGWAIRVYNNDGTITEAFKAYADPAYALSQYPILDEEDFSQREYDATIENIESEKGSVENKLYDMGYGDIDLSNDFGQDWACNVYSMIPDSEIENIDGQGAYPSAESITEAIIYLYLKDVEPEVYE
ncbi:conserved hypothetical protein [Virus Rctr71]|nr:conserved hypothetical protein [Virus Rctr71]